MDDPIARLRWYAGHPLAAARAAHEAGVPVVGITAPTVPAEIILAAGGFPVVLHRPAAPTPHADTYLEAGIFTPRIRGIFEGLLSGEWRFLRAVVIPRTSEQEYKLFLYLRELARTEARRALPPVYLYDLLHTQSPEAHAYGLARTTALRQTIEQVLGRHVSDDDVASAIARRNRARGAMARLVDLRAGRPRLRGSDAIPLLGASTALDADAYADLAGRAADGFEQAPTLDGVRVIVAGTPAASLALNLALESLGAVVTWEEDYAGRMDCARPIAVGGDPVTAVFEHYYAHVPSPRVFPPALADAPFDLAARTLADAVVFSYPPEDYVAGWDYPRRRAHAEAIGLPSIRLRIDPDAIDEASRTALARFLSHVHARG